MNDVDLSGRWQDKIHLFPVRVYYADTDAAGVVYHATYLNYAERARTEMIRLMENDPDWRPGDGVGFVVRACQIEYLRPARLDDRLEVRSKIAELGGASFRASQQIWRACELLVDLSIVIVCTRDVGQPTRIPQGLRDKMTELLTI